MGKTVRISHNRHTLKLLPRQHTSFGVLALLVALFGVLLLNLSNQDRLDRQLAAASGQISVNATVPSNQSMRAAVIISPQNGQHFTSSDVTVSGNCQPDTLIKLFKNDILAGATICDTQGSFSILISLLPGSNVLVARTFNTLNDQGPDSLPVTVYYDVPGNPAATSVPVLNADDLYKGYEVDKEVSFDVNLSGGKGPYAIAVDWGDGTVDPISLPQAGSFTIKHTYHKTGDKPHNSYDITVKATDSSGQVTRLQLVTIVTGQPQSLPLSGQLTVAWPLWILLLVALLAFRFGEVVEKRWLKRKKAGVPPTPPIPPTAPTPPAGAVR